MLASSSAMRNTNGTMTPIRKADKELLRRIAKAKDWSQTTALKNAVRRLAEVEGIEVGEGELAAVGASPASEAGQGEA